MEYPELELHIHNFSDEHGGYLVTAAAEPGDIGGEGQLSLQDLDDESIASAAAAMEVGSLDVDTTRDLGELLFGMLVKGEIADAYQQVRHRPRLRVRLVVDVPAAQQVPWELLHDGERFLAVHGPLARGISTLQPADPLTATLPLRILVVEAFPEGVDKLEGQLEAANIKEALGALINAGKAEVETITGGTVAKVQNALREAAAEPDPRPFHVLHFIGHGRKGVLLFERDGTRARHDVEPQELLTIIEKYQLKLVFLNSCQSVGTSALETADTFAPVLLKSGIPAVIGMQTSVYDAVAVKFSEHFYEALADNSPVDEALADARRIVHVDDPANASHIGVPVCYLRNKSGRILDLQPAVPPAPWWKKTWVIVAVLATLLGLFQGLDWVVLRVSPWFQGPDTMNEFAFNVAVAEFAAGEGVDSSTASDLTDKTFEQINAELAALGFADVWPPEKTGAIRGDKPEERAMDAEELADEVNADVVVYGTLVADGPVADLQPEFFLNDRRLSGATELVGPFRLGSAERFNRESLNAPGELEARLAARTKALAQFVIGLSAYADGDYTAATARFTDAEGVTDWKDDEGKEIVYLFLGNAAGRSGAYLEAATQYERALDIREDYARAWIGLAGASFQEGFGDCRTTFNETVLGQAADQFERALEAEFRPPLADVETKVAFGLGKVYLCQQIAGLPAGDSETEFRKVIDDYESGNTRVEELAWESHAGLGVYYATIPPTDYEKAIIEYQAGIDIIDTSVGAALGRPELNERKAIFYGNMADAMRRAADLDEARDAYETAIALTQDDELRNRLQAELDDLELGVDN